MQNQLIVYVPKKNVKKIILFVILGILLSIVVFAISAFSSAVISLNSKAPKLDNANLMTTTFLYKQDKQESIENHDNLGNQENLDNTESQEVQDNHEEQETQEIQENQ